MEKVTSIETGRGYRVPVRQNLKPTEGTDPENHHRIKSWMGACLVLTAGFIDALQALLTLVAIGVVLSPIISILAAFLFFVWFTILGVSYTADIKKLATFGIQSLGEVIPAIGAFPILTAGILLTVIMTRSEDKGGIISKATNVVSVTKKAA